jgi:queuosine precursor transporter
MKLIAFLSFVGAAVAANWLTNRYGLVPVGFGLVTTAGTFAAGLVLLLRDVLQDLGGRWWVLAAIAAGAGASAFLAGPALALASGAAFAVSELADAAVYTPLRRRGWARAAFASGVVGSAVDSVLFLWLAGFPIWAALPGQMFVKVGVTAAVVLLVVVARAVFRYRVRPEGA